MFQNLAQSIGFWVQEIICFLNIPTPHEVDKPDQIKIVPDVKKEWISKRLSEHFLSLNMLSYFNWICWTL